MKLCKKCLLTKELTDFSKKLNGLQPICKECDKKRRKLYCKENPEKIKESNKKWQLLNKDRQIKWRRDLLFKEITKRLLLKQAASYENHFAFQPRPI